MQLRKAIRVVIYTNLWVSFVYGKFHSPLNRLLVDETIDIVASKELVNEIGDVLNRPKFANRIDQKIINQFLPLLRQSVIMHQPTAGARVGADPKDYFLFALASSSKAQYLITGDKQLLSIKKYKQTKIVSLTEFLDLL